MVLYLSINMKQRKSCEVFVILKEKMYGRLRPTLNLPFRKI